MNCPTCPDTMLVMADRSGVEIDYCPKCRGVWLDRGELDKIIERNAVAEAPAPAAVAAPAPAPQQYPQQQYPQQQYPQQQYPQQQHYKQKKKSSFLGEIFDF
jgi:Zn-finger nucleic acid-binding protein